MSAAPAPAAPPAPLPCTYKRELPPGCVPWSSAEGQARCSQALLAGTMECHFLLSPHFRTQSEPIACGQSTLAMVLNALAPPGPPPYEERGLDCCKPQEEVLTRGLTLGTLACMARCCGFSAAVTRVAPLPDVGPATAAAEAAAARQLPALRGALRAAAASSSGAVLVAAYSREALGQTGATGRAAVGLHSGHYSPLGGYHAASDSALIMDVARFKYEPHWVPLPELFRAMRHADPDTRLPRGYLRISASPLALALQGALGGASAAAAGSWLAALFGAHPSASPSSSEGSSGSGGGGALLAQRAARRCGGQGRLAGAALALLQRREPPRNGDLRAWVEGLRSDWQAEGAAHAEAEYRLHGHPAWGGAPLTPAQAAQAVGVLRALEALPLYAGLQGVLAGAAWAPAPGAALGGEGFCVTPAHRLALVLVLDLGGREGAGGGGGLLAGLPPALGEDVRALWGREEELSCGGCGTGDKARGEREGAL